MSNLFVEIVNSIEAKSIAKDDCKLQIRTGIDELDKSIGGFSRGETILVAGSYGSGKTNLLVSMLKTFVTDKVSCTYYSEEKPKNIAYKLLSWMSGIPLHSLRTGRINDLMWKKLAEGADKLSQMEIDIRPISSMLPDDSKEVIIIDGLESIYDDVLNLRNAYEGSLLILTCGVSEGVHKRPNKRPMMDDIIRNPGLKYIADYVMLLYRDENYNRESEDDGICEVILAKSKNGDTDTFRIPFIEESDSFYTSDAWRTLRYSVILRFGKKCMACGSYKKIHVDHIKPRSKYPELELEESNLQILCEACNLGKGAWDETDWRSKK